MNIIIAGITSEIAECILERFVKEGHSVYGTYRSEPTQKTMELVEISGGFLARCDFANKGEIDDTIKLFSNFAVSWDVIISAVGVLTPIDYFEETSIDDWENNIYVNAIGQIRFIRGLLHLRRPKSSKVFFMTSKGINGVFPAHSAYCIAKMILVKMVELLDDEIDDCSFVAFNPGFVWTKIIAQEDLGKELEKKLQDQNVLVEREKSLNMVCDFVEWALEQRRETISGRVFMVKYDRWKEDSFTDFLLEQEDNYKIRRHGDDLSSVKSISSQRDNKKNARI